MNNLLKKQWELTQSKFKFLDEVLVDKIISAWKLLEKNDFHGCFAFEDDVYHQGAGVSNGHLNNLGASPLKFYTNNYVNPTMEKSNALTVGSLIHTAILEPLKLQDKYISDEAACLRIGGAKPRNTTKFKAFRAEVEASGKILVNQEDYNMCMEMVKNVYKHEKFKNILDVGIVENCVYAIDPTTGILLRCKPDRMLIDKGEILDVKSTADASLQAFQKSIYNFNYQAGAAFYLFVCSLALKKDFGVYLWGCVEKQAPYDTIIYMADTGCLDQGEQIARENINKYVYCLENGDWPGYSKDIEPISVPHWSYK